MDTFTLRPKPDRRTQPRVPPTDMADRAYAHHRRGGEPGHEVSARELAAATTVPSRHVDVLPPGLTPEEGDIVVREDTRDGQRIYVLHTSFEVHHEND